MTTAGDSSDSDRDIGPVKQHGSSHKRLISSSEDETPLEQCKTPLPMATKTESETGESKNSGTGSGGHALRKRQKNFRLPSREEQWSEIRSDPKVSNKLSHLKPRKLINDFTRITHRYNYDNVEVSGEESMEEFIKGTDSSESHSSDCSSSSKDKRTRKQKGHRVRGYRPNIVVHSDSSEDQPPDAGQPHSDTGSGPHLRHRPVTRAAAGRESAQEQPRKRQPGRKQEKSGAGSRKKSQPGCTEDGNSETSDEDSEPVMGAKLPRKKSALDSESEDSSPNSSSYGVDSLKLKANKQSRPGSVHHLDSAKDTDQRVLPSEDDSQDMVTPSRKKARAKSLLLDSDPEELDPDATNQNPSQDKQASVLQECDRAQDAPDKGLTGGGSEVSGRGVDTESAVTGVGVSSDSAITVSDSADGSGSDDASQSDERSQEDSSDGVECSRIEKLASLKKQKRESMLDRFKAVRAKRQSKK